MGAEPKVTSYSENFPKISVDNLLELFRNLRQTTTSKLEQDENAKEILPCLQLLAKVVDYLGAGSADNVIDKFVLSVCARVGVQFLGNAIVDNEENQKLIWTHSNLLRSIFFYKDTKLRNYVSMIYLNIIILNNNAREELLIDEEFINELIDEAMLGLTEFPQFFVEKFLELNYYDKIYSDKRKPVHKIYILDLLLSLIKNDKVFVLDPKSIEKISSDFKNEAEFILNGLKQKTESSTSSTDELQKDKQELNTAKVDLNEEPGLAVKLLSTLCSLSIDDKYSKLIFDNTSLIIDTIYVLRALKMAESIKKESGFEQTESDEPIIGFKADLIRLLGNVCFKHKKNQDLVRENNCIELILDCCKMDEKNPFICEWSIMAIRNLCEENQANQDLIASLKRTTETEIVAATENIQLISVNENLIK